MINLVHVHVYLNKGKQVRQNPKADSEKNTELPRTCISTSVSYFVSQPLSPTFSHKQEGMTAVLCASQEGCIEVVKLLVKAKADIELQHKVQWVCDKQVPVVAQLLVT